MRCRRCAGAGRHRGPPEQRGVLRRLFRRGTCASRCAGDRGGTTCSTRGTACWSPSRAARIPSRCGTSCSSSGTTPTAVPGSWDRGVLGPLARDRAGVRVGARCRPVEVDLARDYGFDMPTAGTKGSRSTCAVCGLSKRYVFNRAALEGGYDVVATGHNLDDEAATLLGNTLRWQTRLHRAPVPGAAGGGGHGAKVKPLYRLSELETAAFAFLRGIDYVVEECPLVGGNTQLRYKDAMNATRDRPRRGPRRSSSSATWTGPRRCSRGQDEAELVGCERCGQPTTGRFCAFCRAQAQILGERLGEPRGGRDEPRARTERSRDGRVAVGRGHAGRDLRRRG